MSNLSKKLLITLTTFYLLLTTPSPIHAQEPWGTECVGPTSMNASNVATIQGLECVVYNILQVAIYLIGIGVLVMLVLGAYKLLTSGGDPKGVEGGKNTITYAILGLVLAICAWFILRLIAEITGAQNILNFSTQIGS